MPKKLTFPYNLVETIIFLIRNEIHFIILVFQSIDYDKSLPKNSTKYDERKPNK